MRFMRAAITWYILYYTITCKFAFIQSLYNPIIEEGKIMAKKRIFYTCIFLALRYM